MYLFSFILFLKLIDNDVGLRNIVQDNILDSLRLVLSLFGMDFKEKPIIYGVISPKIHYAEGFNYLLK